MREGWQVTTLGDAFQTVTGNTPPKSRTEYYGNYIPFVKPPQLMDGRIISAIDNLSESGASVARMLPENSILISCIGNLGKIGIAGTPLAFNQQINAIVPDESKVVPFFLFYYALSSGFQCQLESFASGTTVPIVNKSKFNQISISLPALPEQEQIVAILDEAFAGIASAVANTKKNLANARELLASQIENEFSTVRDGVRESKLSELCERVTVGHVGTTSPYYRDEGVIFIRTQNLGSNVLDLTDTKYITQDFHDSLKKSEVFGNDLLISRVVTDVIKCAIVPEGLGPLNCANVILARPPSRLMSEFLQFLITSHTAQSWLLGQRVGSAQQVVNTKVLKDWMIPCPTISEQRAIVDRLRSFQDKAATLETIYQKKLDDLAELKQSILQKAFAGELTAGPDKSLAKAGL